MQCSTLAGMPHTKLSDLLVRSWAAYSMERMHRVPHWVFTRINKWLDHTRSFTRRWMQFNTTQVLYRSVLSQEFIPSALQLWRWQTENVEFAVGGTMALSVIIGVRHGVRLV